MVSIIAGFVFSPELAFGNNVLLFRWNVKGVTVVVCRPTSNVIAN
jgi:hypothetical protein